MDNLLCDESLPWSPLTPEQPLSNFGYVFHEDDVKMAPAMEESTVEEALSLDLEKELCMSNHGDKFIEFLVSKKLTDARFHAVQWLIQTRSRLNLSYETVFSAASCFDRFVYVISSDEWRNWMVEIVALTSLSIASKFNEVTSPSLQELQISGLNHMFHHKTVLEMELIMLKALQWRVHSVSSYSFSQILMSKIGWGRDHMMMNRITHLLLDLLCDTKMLKYPPSVVAVSAVWNVLEEKSILDGNNIGRLFGQEHKEKIVKCVEEMKMRKTLKSEVKVKVKEEYYYYKEEEGGGNLSAIFQILQIKRGSYESDDKDDKKRDRDHFDDDDQVPPSKRMTFLMSI